MKKLATFLCLCLCILFFYSNASALSILASDQNVYSYGYGNSSWNNMTSALDTATGNNVTIGNFDDLATMLSYDALWLDTRNTNSELTALELYNISEFIDTGRRVVLNGENTYWDTWNSSILSIVGGTVTNQNGEYNTNSIVDNELTNAASTVYLPYTGIAAIGGTALYDQNFATLWGDNVLSILDVNIFSDEYWGRESNGIFANNVANWIASSNSNNPVPEPATILLMGAGLLGLAGYSRKRSGKKS